MSDFTPVTAVAVLAGLPASITLADASAALAKVDQDSIYTTERALWTYSLWDRTSAINGVPADHFLSRADVPATGEVYLLLRDAQLVIFQPHDPTQAGVVPIASDQVEAVATAHADAMAAQRATEAIRVAAVALIGT